MINDKYQEESKKEEAIFLLEKHLLKINNKNVDLNKILKDIDVFIEQADNSKYIVIDNNI